MVEGMNQTEDSKDPKKEEKKKKRQANILILGAVFLLSAILPPPYKAFSPLLFLLSPLLDVLNKMRDESTQPGVGPQNQYSSTYIPRPPSSTDPYSYRPKDPKDPRKYKPIG